MTKLINYQIYSDLKKIYHKTKMQIIKGTERIQWDPKKYVRA